MSRYIDTTGKTTIAVAVCDRCHMKRALASLVQDRNSPGLMVCADQCNDLYDPYRLPARRTEKISLRYPRPEEPLK